MLLQQNIFIVGIKGVAMANIAVILKQLGKNVSGWDTSEEFITDKTLNLHGIVVVDALPPDTDLVIYSAAHQGKNNSLVGEAFTRKITVLTQPQALAEIMQDYETRIAICGSHGKTTTAALLAFCLKELGVNPGYMVGTSDFNGMDGGAAGDKKYFVVEADEYAIDPPADKTAKFLLLNPTHILATNIDFDHPDVYASLDETKHVFTEFFKKVVRNNLFVCADDIHLQHSGGVSYGFSDAATYQIKNTVSQEQSVMFELFAKDKVIEQFDLDIFGEKNIANAAGVISLLLSLGFESDKIKDVISKFTGAKRRFELVAHENNTYLFDDYGHHPVEISATIQAARSRFPERRIIVIFQPHTYSRTEALKNEFVTALKDADEAFIAPIFASAREKGQEHTISSLALEHLAKAQNIATIHGCSTTEEILTGLERVLRPHDVVFTMGAGDIYKLKDGIIKLIKQAK